MRAIARKLSRVITYESSVTIPGKDISGTSGIVAKLEFTIRAMETNYVSALDAHASDRRVSFLDRLLASPTKDRESIDPSYTMKFFGRASTPPLSIEPFINRRSAGFLLPFVSKLQELNGHKSRARRTNERVARKPLLRLSKHPRNFLREI